MDPTNLSAGDTALAIAEGRLESEELVTACLDNIAATEETVRAWAFLDREHALRQARAADGRRRQGRAAGPLNGVPVGIKDVFDTADMPTENGTPLHAGRRPTEDATVVGLLRQAGAVILGKTVTTELAVYAPGKTRNPHDPARTPGGSSSGSAAAVAAGMVPLALGTQTNGSVIRPASFCGVCGFKPTFGLISRHNVLRQSPPLDHVGMFARTVGDLALLAEILMVHDDRDPAMRLAPPPELGRTAIQEPPVRPRLAFVKTPAWDRADTDTREAFAVLVEVLGDAVEEAPLPAIFADAYDWHRTIMEADLALSFGKLAERAGDRLSSRLREMIARGHQCLAVDYNLAVDRIPLLNDRLEPFFEDFDAILTPAAPGEAPLGLESTGDPVFCTPWTLCGTPAVTLPLLRGTHGLPIGVQLVGRRGDDGRLLRTARWLANAVAT